MPVRKVQRYARLGNRAKKRLYQNRKNTIAAPTETGERNEYKAC